MSGKPVISKDQRAGRIKWSDIEVQIHTITGEKDYGQIGNFADGAVWWTIKQAESNWRSCRCLQVVSIHKFRVYKAMSRPRVDKSSEQDFIKIILTKDQGRDKRNKEQMCWVELDLLQHREVQHGPQSIWSPGYHSLFFWGFLRSSCWSTIALKHNCGLLLGTEVQLVVSCTTIEAQVVFKILLVLVAGQLAIAGQLGREVHPQSIELFFGSRGWR